MAKRIDDNRGIRNAARMAAAVVATCTALAGGPAHAETSGPDWRSKVHFYVNGMTNYRASGSESTSYDVVAAIAELKFSSASRPYYGGFFADYRYSSSAGFDRNSNLGGFLRYNLPRWDATSWLFVNRSPGDDHAWLYAGRLRYRLLENHKIGIEAFGALEDPGALTLSLGYYGSVSRYLSLNVLAGSGLGQGPDLAARVELSWQIR